MRYLFVAAVALAATSAAAEECTGPFRQCAIDVVAECTRDPDGVQRMTYVDISARTVHFERCVGRIYEARGLPNPYKTGVIPDSDELEFPRAEFQSPRSDGNGG